MLSGISFREIQSVLEPSAGKGDICDVIRSRIDSHYSRRSNIIDVIEINPDLQATLRGKGYHLVQDDFLSFQTQKPYDLIIANFPFSTGEHHLEKALAMLKRNGGQLVCLVNAETLRNPWSNLRNIITRQLMEWDAQIEYLAGEFKDAERPTQVDVALIRVKRERQPVEPLLLHDLKCAQAAVSEADIHEQIIEKDYINAMVAQFNFECKLGVRLIEEYFALKPYILNALPKKDETNSYSSPLIELKIKGESLGSAGVNAYIDRYLPMVRQKYWSVLVNDPRYTGQFTENILQDLRAKLTELANYDFNRFNIEQLGKDLAMRINKGVEKAILDLFDTFSRGHAWHQECDNGNIHYYTGWKTNKAWRVNKRVIIPLHGISAWSNSIDYQAFEKLRDMVKVFNYLSADKDPPKLLSRSRYDHPVHPGEVTDFRYFEIKLYKKGTCHITFKDQDLLDKFNIFGSQRKGWLPPGYGKKPYEDLDRDERDTVDTFEGREHYERVVSNSDYFIVEDAAGLLGGGMEI